MYSVMMTCWPGKVEDGMVTAAWPALVMAEMAAEEPAATVVRR